MAVSGYSLAQLPQRLHQTRLLASISSSHCFDRNAVMLAAAAPWGSSPACCTSDISDNAMKRLQSDESIR